MEKQAFSNRVMKVLQWKPEKASHNNDSMGVSRCKQSKDKSSCVLVVETLQKKIT